jgi:hypothetical protein
MKIKLELPSGTSLSQKIIKNSKEWEAEFLERIKDEKPGDVARELEARIKDNVHFLLMKVAVTFQHDGQTYWAGM